jgi:hypothetical protein
MSKPGMVVSIRVNPADCQSVLDLMQVVNIDPYDGRSFSSCVALAFSSLVDMSKRAGIIQEPDPFQFLNRMGVFLDSRNNKKKHAITGAMLDRAAHGLPPPSLPMQSVGSSRGPYIPDHAQGQAQVMGWTENGPVSTAAVPMQMDEETRNMLFEEYNTLNERLNNREKLTPEEKERYTYLDRFFCG